MRPGSSDGPYPVTTICTTAGVTFDTTVSKELCKARSKFDDAAALETRAGDPESVRASVDCASAEVAARKKTTMLYFIHCNLVIV